MEGAESFGYLGSAVTEGVICDSEVKRGIGIAKNGFCNKRNILTNRKLSIRARKRYDRNRPSFLYGEESWNPSVEMEKRLEAMEMYVALEENDEDPIDGKNDERNNAGDGRSEERVDEDAKGKTAEDFGPCNKKRRIGDFDNDRDAWGSEEELEEG